MNFMKIVFSNLFFALLGLGLIFLLFLWQFPIFRILVFSYDVLLFAFAIVDYLVSRKRLQNLEVRREFGSRFAIGEKTTVYLILKNNSNKSFFVHVKDEYPPQMHLIGHREAKLVIDPKKYVKISYDLVPPKRGKYEFGVTAIRFLSNLKLVWCQSSLNASEFVKVYPNIGRAKNIFRKALGRQNLVVTERKIQRRGEGREFESLRDYVLGDELRHISWTATARRAKLTTKQYQIEREQTILIAIDSGRLMTGRIENETKFEIAIHAGLALMLMAARIGDNSGLVIFGRRIRRFIPPSKGIRHINTVLEALYDLEPELIEPSYSRAFRFIASNIKKRSLIIIITDLIDKDASERFLNALKLLRPNHLPLVTTVGDRDLYSVVSSIPKDSKELFLQSAAEEILLQRETALKMVESIGGLAIDVTTSTLAPKLIETYLKIKERALI
jgi:uncharacterized protein (DUF58 family)